MRERPLTPEPPQLTAAVVAPPDATCTHCRRRALFGWVAVDDIGSWWLCALHWAPIRRHLKTLGELGVTPAARAAKNAQRTTTA